MTRFALPCALAFAALGCAAPAPVDDPAARRADSAEKIEVVEETTRDAVVCRYETMTGSHRKQRVCRTVAERDAERESGKDTMRQIQRPRARPPD